MFPFLRMTIARKWILQGCLVGIGVQARQRTSQSEFICDKLGGKEHQTIVC